MPTLTTKDRNALPDGIFGLPKDRKYPLTDESHVRKAIQYFKFCSPSKRNELSKNINTRAKELGMTINISKDSTFYRFADKKIIKESSFMHDFTDEITYKNMEELLSKIEKELADKMHKFIRDLSISPPDPDIFKDLEEKIQRHIFTSSKLKMIIGEMGIQHSTNPMKIINDAMTDCYKTLFGFIRYNNPEIDLTTHNLLTCIFEDIFYYLNQMIWDWNRICKIKEKFCIIEEIVAHYKCNNFYLLRKLKEFQITVESHKSTIIKDTDAYRAICEVESLLRELMIYVSESCDSIVSNVIKQDTKILDILWSSNMNLTNSVEYLKVLKNEMKSEIDIIRMTGELNTSLTLSTNNDLFFLQDVIDHNNREILSILSQLDGRLVKSNIKYYNEKYSVSLTSTDVMSLSELNKFERLYTGKDTKGDVIYYGICKDKLYLLGKIKSTGQLLLIKLYDKKPCLHLLNLTCHPAEFASLDKMKATKITVSRCQDLQPLTEGISFTANGDFKFSFKPKKTYMDEYSENHKLLVENFRSKNYEGMKTNLAFLFELINTIERRVYSKKAIKPELKRDAEKARMFAINDFKTYLRELQKAEPDFNFTTYYEESDFGKVTIGIKKEDIIGARRLFQSIILS